MADHSLSSRRAALIARCAEQRLMLAGELLTFPKPGMRPFAGGLAALLGARLLANKRLALGVASAALGLAVLRPARLLRVARFAASSWRMAQKGMTLLARCRNHGARGA
jgi:hypothetical protein